MVGGERIGLERKEVREKDRERGVFRERWGNREVGCWGQRDRKSGCMCVCVRERERERDMWEGREGRCHGRDRLGEGYI